MLLFHPCFQLSAILLALYVFYLGVKRFCFNHLHKPTAFPWKRHVILGSLSITILLSGMIMGMIMVYTYWQGFLMTGVHGKIAIILVPFLLFGITSGLYMNVRKTKRKALPLMHGINNVIVLCLAASQVFTGWEILKTFVFGL